MKHNHIKTLGILFVLAALICLIPATALAAEGDVALNATNFPDANFRQALAVYDTNSDNVLSKAECANVVYLTMWEKKISNLKGIEHFPNLEELDCRYNKLTSLDVSKNTKLKTLKCDNNQLTSLNVSNNSNLISLECDNNSLASLNISGCPALKTLWCRNNLLASLSTANNPELIYLIGSSNRLTSLNVSGSSKLHELDVWGNRLTSLNLAGNTVLNRLDCSDNNLNALNVRQNTALAALICSDNNLTTLDVSQNTALGSLSCSGNKLTGLSLTNNPNLKYLSCERNTGLTSLTLSNAAGLKSLRVGYNTNLPALNLSNLPALESLGVQGMGLTSLDITRNPALKYLQAYGNPALAQLDLRSTPLLDDAVGDGWSYTGEDGGVPFVRYSWDGDLYVGANTKLITTAVPIDAEHFPDVKFRTLVADYDINSNNYLSPSELEQVTVLSCAGQGIEDLTGIEYFTALTRLECPTNMLTSLDVSHNTELIELYVNENASLAALDVSQNTKLEVLNCSSCSLNALDISSLSALRELYCSYNNLTALDLSHNPELEILICGGNRLTGQMDSMGLTKLVYLDCSNNNLGGIFVTALQDLKMLDCHGNSNLMILAVGGNPALETIHAYDCNIRTFPINQTSAPEFSALKEIDIHNNYLPNLNLTKAPALERLNCSENSLNGATGLNLNGNAALKELYCNDTSMSKLDLSANTALVKLDISGNQYITALDLSTNRALNYLDCTGTGLTQLNITAAPALVHAVLYDSGNTVTGNTWYISDRGRLHVGAAVELLFAEISLAFPDENFRQYVSTRIDTDGSGWLSPAEINAVTSIDCHSWNIASLQGIEYFKELTRLECYTNLLTELDVSLNPKLTKLYCYGNSGLTELDLRTVPKLFETLANGTRESSSSYERYYLGSASAPTGELRVDYATTLLGTVQINGANFPDEAFRSFVQSKYDLNKDYYLTPDEILPVIEMDCSNKNIYSLKGIEHFAALKKLTCSGNKLTALDVSQNTALTMLICYGNQLTALDVSQNTALTTLLCYGNQLTALDLSQNTALTYLDCRNNQLTTLDISQNTALAVLICSDNNLTTLDISQNAALRELRCYNNQLTALDISQNAALRELRCGENQLTALNLGENAALEYLSCSGNQLRQLNLFLNNGLKEVYCYNNLLSILVLPRQAGELKNLFCYGNGNLRSLDLGTAAKLIDATRNGTKVISNSEYDRYYKNGTSSNPGGDLRIDKTLRLAPAVPTLVKIEIATQPTKTVYTTGSKFNTSGMEMLAHYSDGGFGPRTGYTWTPDGALTKEDKLVTVSYYESGVTRTATIPIEVYDPPVITTVSLPTGYVGQPYDAQLEATGDGTFTWRLDSSSSSYGRLPAGLTLSEDGRITGVPLETWGRDVYIKVTSEYGTKSKYLYLNIKSSPVDITTHALPVGRIGQPYSFQLEAESQGAVTWWIDSSYPLPAGLSMSEDGLITGTPAAPGTTRIRVRAQNDRGGSDDEYIYFVVLTENPYVMTGMAVEGYETHEPSYYGYPYYRLGLSSQSFTWQGADASAQRNREWYAGGDDLYFDAGMTNRVQTKPQVGLTYYTAVYGGPGSETAHLYDFSALTVENCTLDMMNYETECIEIRPQSWTTGGFTAVFRVKKLADSLECTITIDLNGGILQGESIYGPYGGWSLNVPLGLKLDLCDGYWNPAQGPVVPPAGTDFLGMEIGGKLYLPGEKYTATGNVTAKCFWKPTGQCALRFDANGGIPGVNWQNTAFVISGQNYTVTEPTVHIVSPPAGMVFDGMEINGVRYAAGQSCQITQNVTTIKYLWRSETPPAENHTVSGTAASWNSTNDAVYLLYDAGLADKAIRAAWQNNTYATMTGVQAYTAAEGSIASATVDGKAMKTQTFSFEGVADGTYKLAIFKPGKYVPKIVTVTVSGGDVTLGTLKLWLYGDVNYDGIVKATDAAQINRHVNGQSSIFSTGDEQTKADRLLAADVNLDGNIKATDAAQINRYANGQSSFFNNFK